MEKKKRWGYALLGCVLALLAAAAGLFLYSRNADIPRLYFTGDISQMLEKSDVREIAVRYEDGDTTFTGYAKLKVQGTSSLLYDKKNYTINLYADEGCEKKMPVDLGWGAQSKYCLKANWIDRTHARNVVSAKLVSQMQEKYGVLTQAPRNGAVDGFPVEIYSNGRFLGLYTFNIPKDEWQFAMDSDDPDHIVIGGEGWDPANYFRADPDFGAWEVEVGEENEETLEKVKGLFDFIRYSSDEEFVAEFEEHIDLDAALNYYVMADMAYLFDNLGKNMLLATYDGKKWYPSLYDLDTSWGVHYSGLRESNHDTAELEFRESLLFERMEDLFSQEIARRYFELRETVLSEEHILAEFEAFREQIPEITFVKEYLRWGSGQIRRREDLPGFEYDQIQAYLDRTTRRLDAKYGAILEG